MISSTARKLRAGGIDMAQRVHVICHVASSKDTFGLDELNKLLEQGWSIAKTEQLSVADPSSGGSHGVSYHASFALAFVLQKA